jgi:hypothetical protein
MTQALSATSGLICAWASGVSGVGSRLGGLGIGRGVADMAGGTLSAPAEDGGGRRSSTAAVSHARRSRAHGEWLVFRVDGS